MRLKLVVIAVFVSLLAANPGYGTWGVLDKVPGATVILPFFEVGIDSQQNPQDTLPVITSTWGGQSSVVIHWQVYNIDGFPTMSGNEFLNDGASWSFSLRQLISDLASEDDKTVLTDGDFYRGFMTFDVVDHPTSVTPFTPGYPFSSANVLVGYAYYARLAQGSANGLVLPTLESTVANPPSPFLRGFYGNADNLERMDLDARNCSQSLTEGGTCVASLNRSLSISSRVFQSIPINGKTRVIVFAWYTPLGPQSTGPSMICDHLDCASEYITLRLRENGETVDAQMLRLDHVVNVIDLSGETVAPGTHLLAVEDPGSGLQVFAFAFNSASPLGNPAINWDAIFESAVTPIQP